MIKVLDKFTADKIAAGEVIERPVSIVKELVENALDSGASSVVVEIKNGGKTYIRVTDDGCGIPYDETETAFLRHATSKIKTAKDLEEIETLGFRGEALASICAVTHTELITKEKNAKLGTRLLIHGGNIIDKVKAGCPDGTTIVVTDLFYNTPARLKFLKSDGAESSQIIDFISQIALCYKDIKFRLINNGKVLFTTLGDGNRLNTIIRVFPDVEAKNLVKVDYSDNASGSDLRIEGYISTPAMSRNTRSSEIFFVNGRVVNSKVIEKGISIGYKERLFEGRYPVCYLFLSSDPSKLDVNIHPNKKEVRFDNENAVSDFVGKAIISTLNSQDAVVDIGNIFDYQLKKEKSENIFKKVLEPLREESSVNGRTDANHIGEKDYSYKSVYGDKGNLGNDNKSADVIDNKSVKLNNKSDNDDTLKLNSIKETNETGKVEEQLDIKSFLSTRNHDSDNSGSALNSDIPVKPVSSENIKKYEKSIIDIYEPKLRPFDFEELRVTGVLFDTYITCIDYNNFYIFDQHAAHERIFYEELVGQYDKEEKFSQPLLIPSLITVSISSDNEKSNWMEPLSRMGFVINEFGPQTYRIEEIPMFMDIDEAEEFVNNFIEGISSSTDLRNTVVVNKLIIMSCKSAVKANDVLKPEEIKALIDRLAKCKNPFSCPHGRPTFVKMSRYEIEKLFKRIQ